MARTDPAVEWMLSKQSSDNLITKPNIHSGQRLVIPPDDPLMLGDGDVAFLYAGKWREGTVASYTAGPDGAPLARVQLKAGELARAEVIQVKAGDRARRLSYAKKSASDAGSDPGQPARRPGRTVDDLTPDEMQDVLNASFRHALQRALANAGVSEEEFRAGLGQRRR